MAVPLDYQEKIKVALDCLPWKSLSWSIHRGMREILLAFGKPIMNKFRANLAALLHRFVASKPVALTRIGWDLKFVQESMGEVAFSAMLEGSGDSCDLVRVVTDIARVYLVHKEMQHDLETLNDVDFWRLANAERQLDAAGIIALTKFFVLEWSIETDYQLYHQLPLTMNFG